MDSGGSLTRLERLLHVARQLASAQTTEEVAAAVVDAGAEAVAPAKAGMWLLDARGDALLVRSRNFLPQHAEAFARVPASLASPLHACMQSGRPLWLSSRAEYHERFPDFETQHRPSAAGPVAFGIVPVTLHGSVAGCLMFSFHDERRLSGDERTFLEILGRHATDALARAQLNAERARVEHGREIVARAAEVLSRSLDWEQTIHQVVTVPVPSFADWTGVDLLDGDHLNRIATTTESVPLRILHEPERGGSSGAIATGKPQVIRDLDQKPYQCPARDMTYLRAMRALGMKSFVCVPLRVGDAIVGAFSFGSHTRNFDALDISVAEHLASHAATALENARLYREAQAARREAEAATRAKDEFLAMLGHELRNPLAPISTALELMAIRTKECTHEREVIVRQVTHLTRLVDDLLDVSRIARGMIELKLVRTTVASFVARAVELASPLIEQRRHQLEILLEPDLAIDADATRLAQVLTNLLTNAARYTAPGGRITIWARAADDAVLLGVADTGIGIAPDVLPRVFDLFEQGPQSIARTEGGLGLGLSIVRNLVELHGGTVTVRSAGLGRGTEFVVRLPASRQEHVEQLNVSTAAALQKRRRILIVDDNQDAAMLLGEILDEHGHDIRTAFDGPDALRVADEFRPEVALLDIGLPLMDGYELARRLRESPLHAQLRLIAVSGYGQMSDGERARRAGFAHHVAKPIPVDRLIELVGD